MGILGGKKPVEPDSDPAVTISELAQVINKWPGMQPDKDAEALLTSMLSTVQSCRYLTSADQKTVFHEKLKLAYMDQSIKLVELSKFNAELREEITKMRRQSKESEKSLFELAKSSAMEELSEVSYMEWNDKNKIVMDYALWQKQQQELIVAENRLNKLSLIIFVVSLLNVIASVMGVMCKWSI